MFMQKALINKLLLILYGRIKNIFAALGLHTTDVFTISYAPVIVMPLLFGFCIVLHALKTNGSLCETRCDFIAFHLSSSFSFPFASSEAL